MTNKITPLLSFTLLMTALNGCSGTPAVVQTGDRVELSFTCRLPNGELAATTKPDSAFGADRKSPYYLPRSGPETVSLTAGAQAADQKQDRVSFEDEIIKRLGFTLAGLKEGEQSFRELHAERYPAASPRDRYVRMATFRKRQKEMRLSLEEFSTRTGKTPEVGQRLVIDPLLPGRVIEVTDKEVIILFAPEPGKPLTTPFGPVTLRETPAQQYELEIKVEKGRLVRTGGMVGRISAVDGDSFEIDYGHPFGGEKLLCDVAVASVKSAEKKNVVAETVPVAMAGDKLDPRAEKVFEEGLAKMLSMSGQSPSTNEAARSGEKASQSGVIDWIDNFDSGLARAKQENKPVFLMLHADWCGWCKKTFTETMPDPRIMALKDRFVWVRVNSDKELKYKQQYGQEGYPMMVVLNPDGTVLKKIDGYRDARVLSEEIKAVLN